MYMGVYIYIYNVHKYPHFVDARAWFCRNSLSGAKVSAQFPRGFCWGFFRVGFFLKVFLFLFFNADHLYISEYSGL